MYLLDFPLKFFPLRTFFISFSMALDQWLVPVVRSVSYASSTDFGISISGVMLYVTIASVKLKRQVRYVLDGSKGKRM